MKFITDFLDHRFKNNVRSEKKALEEIYFLHIGKCAGSQVASIAEKLDEQSSAVRIRKLQHHVYLKDIPEDVRYFFAIRDPISRFVSGFYSRKRRGRPRYDFEWSRGEALAFSEFEHAGDLAEALFSDGLRGRSAFMAIKSIRHTSQDQVDWFCRNGDFLGNRPPIWILRTEHFSIDLGDLSQRIGIDLTGLIAETENGSVVRHSNNYSDVPDLSEKAQSNLLKWYAQDCEFYRQCELWMSQQRGVKDVS